MSRSSTVPLALALAFVLLTTGCNRERADSIAANIGFDPAGPIPTLPECDAQELAAGRGGDPETVEGLVLPDGAVLDSVSEVGPLVQASATVAKTPVAVREHYEQRSDVTLLSSEDEVFEAELLLGVDGQHVHVTAVALCAEGSGIDLMIAPAGEGDLPSTLAGPGTTSTPRRREPVGQD